MQPVQFTGCLRTVHFEAGGGGGIRTPETLTGLTVFKTAGFNRSPTPPLMIINHLFWGLGTKLGPFGSKI